MSDPIPSGKLPHALLADLLARNPIIDPTVILGPRPGEDAAVIDIGDRYLLAKTDPITIATDEIGWYAINVNANDIAATGGTPAYFMATLLLPEGQTTAAATEAIFEQIYRACEALNISLIGGHTEITHGIDRPLITGMMLGFAPKDRLTTTGGAQPGDILLLTKGIPIEAIAIIAREKADLLRESFDEDFIATCANYLYDPGISVVKDSQIALAAGRVHAMHDPTEGGLATGLWEMAEASGQSLYVDLSEVILSDGAALCKATGLDPLGAIASGSLLMAVHPDDAAAISAALENDNIAVFEVGYVKEGDALVFNTSDNDRHLPRPSRDEITKIFE